MNETTFIGICLVKKDSPSDHLVFNPSRSQRVRNQDRTHYVC